MPLDTRVLWGVHYIAKEKKKEKKKKCVCLIGAITRLVVNTTKTKGREKLKLISKKDY